MFSLDIVKPVLGLPIWCVPLDEPPRVLAQPEKVSVARIAKLSAASADLSVVFMVLVIV